MQDWEDKRAVELSSESKKIHTDNIFDFKSEISRQVVYDFVYVFFFDAEDSIGKSYFLSGQSRGPKSFLPSETVLRRLLVCFHHVDLWYINHSI
jgi:hypothetical protein